MLKKQADARRTGGSRAASQRSGSGARRADSVVQTGRRGRSPRRALSPSPVQARSPPPAPQAPFSPGAAFEAGVSQQDAHQANVQYAQSVASITGQPRPVLRAASPAQCKCRACGLTLTTASTSCPDCGTQLPPVGINVTPPTYLQPTQQPDLRPSSPSTVAVPYTPYVASHEPYSPTPYSAAPGPRDVAVQRYVPAGQNVLQPPGAQQVLSGAGGGGDDGGGDGGGE